MDRYYNSTNRTKTKSLDMKIISDSIGMQIYNSILLYTHSKIIIEIPYNRSKIDEDIWEYIVRVTREDSKVKDSVKIILNYG